MNISVFKMGANEYVFFLVSAEQAALDDFKLQVDKKWTFESICRNSYNSDLYLLRMKNNTGPSTWMGRKISYHSSTQQNALKSSVA